jgi:hypothetical protein
MITKENLKQEIEQLDPAYLELVFKLLQQFPHQPAPKPDIKSCSRPINYSEDDESQGLAFTDIEDAAAFGKQLRAASWQRQ